MRCLLPALVSLALIPGSAAAEGRFALVIGTSDYDHLTDLPNPSDDADDIADLLKSLGFDVTEEPDRDSGDLHDAVADFAEDAKNADLALIYYAGHGAEVDRQNRLLTTNTSAESLAALAETSVPLTEVVTTVSAAVPGAILLLVDACRNDPFAGTPLAEAARNAVSLPEADRPIAPGLARLGPAEGLIYAFATAPGDVASDGPPEGNSPFTAALLRHLATPGLDVRTVLTLVTQDVYDRTRGDQTPYVESGLPAFIFTAGQPPEISERDALLLAMADLTAEARAEVEALAADRNMPLAPLYAALLTLDPTRTSRDDQTRALEEAADTYTQFQTQLANLSDADPRVAELRTAAAEAMELGVFGTARSLLADAASIDETARSTLKENYVARTVSQAETLFLQADAARTARDETSALQAYDRIESLLVEVEPLGISASAASLRTDALFRAAHLRRILGDLESAVETAKKHASIASARAEAMPDDTELQHDLALAYGQLGDILIQKGDFEFGPSFLSESAKIFLELSGPDHGDPVLAREVAAIYRRLALVAKVMGDIDKALEATIFARDMLLWISEASSDDVSLYLEHAAVQIELGDLYAGTDNAKEATKAYSFAVQIADLLVLNDPEDPNALQLQANALLKNGRLLLSLGNTEGAIDSFSRAVQNAETLRKNDPANTIFASILAGAWMALGDVAMQQGDLDASEIHYKAAIELSLSLAEASPGNLGLYQLVIGGTQRRGLLAQTRGDNDLAAKYFAAALDLAKSGLALAKGGSVELEMTIVSLCHSLSEASNEGAPCLNDAAAALSRLAASGQLPDHQTHWIELIAAARAKVPSQP